MTDKTDTKKQAAGAKPPAPLKRRGNLVYAVNPFMEGEQRPNIKPKLKRITNRRGDMLVMGETGEIVNPVAGFWQSQEVDSAKETPPRTWGGAMAVLTAAISWGNTPTNVGRSLYIGNH